MTGHMENVKLVMLASPQCPRMCRLGLLGVEDLTFVFLFFVSVGGNGEALLRESGHVQPLYPGDGSPVPEGRGSSSQAPVGSLPIEGESIEGENQGRAGLARAAENVSPLFRFANAGFRGER